MSKSKHQDLQPWLDYFKMLQQYEAKGFLEIKPQEHEAYITRAALLTLIPEDVSSFKFFDERSGKAERQVSSEPTDSKAAAAQLETLNLKLETCVSAIRAYAAYRWAPAVGQQHPVDINDPDAEIPVIPIEELTAYLSQPFATHIVKEDYPHDLLLTLLLQQKRTRYGRTKDVIEVIDYTEQKTEEK